MPRSQKRLEAVDLATIIRKARYGHRDWVVWTDRAGTLHGQKACRAAIKAALLALGTQGKWLIIGASTGILYRHDFNDGCRMMRNARHLWGA